MFFAWHVCAFILSSISYHLYTICNSNWLIILSSDGVCGVQFPNLDLTLERLFLLRERFLLFFFIRSIRSNSWDLRDRFDGGIWNASSRDIVFSSAKLLFPKLLLLMHLLWASCSLSFVRTSWFRNKWRFYSSWVVFSIW